MNETLPTRRTFYDLFPDGAATRASFEAVCGPDITAVLPATPRTCPKPSSGAARRARVSFRRRRARRCAMDIRRYVPGYRPSSRWGRSLELRQRQGLESWAMSRTPRGVRMTSPCPRRRNTSRSGSCRSNRPVSWNSRHCSRPSRTAPLRQALRSSRTRASLPAVRLDGNRSVRYTGGYSRFFLAIRLVSLSGAVVHDLYLAFVADLGKAIGPVPNMRFAGMLSSSSRLERVTPVRLQLWPRGSHSPKTFDDGLRFAGDDEACNKGMMMTGRLPSGVGSLYSGQ